MSMRPTLHTLAVLALLCLGCTEATVDDRATDLSVQASDAEPTSPTGAVPIPKFRPALGLARRSPVAWLRGDLRR